VGIGVNNVTGIKILGVPSYRNPEIPASDGMSLFFTWTMDGMRFCFAGVPTRPLDAEQISQIGTVDVLLLNPEMLSPEARSQIVAQLRPHLVIPIGSRGWTTGGVHTSQGPKFAFTREMLPQQTTTLLFNP
jgi:L-ascorbate metabolism protein UlaG (beta-lactamase superfamily)